MPTLARADINTATNKSRTEQQGVIKSSVISEISVTARIDYILRFSQQAVLVVAEETEIYSAIARQFLVTLSSESIDDPQNNQCNVAFVSASIKLNDIQIRCRLIEQLFGTSLFDPEQSLAVSVLRLAKQQSEAIIILVEHAHVLSLQIKYELSQLVAIAKKNKQVINVVMFGQPKAAEKIIDNKSLFKNKLAMVDGITGQLYSAKSSESSDNSNIKWLKPWQKIVLFTSLMLMGVVSVFLYFYLQTEQGSGYLQKPVMVKNKDKNSINQETLKEIKLNKAAVLEIEKQQNLLTTMEERIVQTANSEEIFQALINPNLLANRGSKPAKTNDVLSALFTEEEVQIPTSDIEVSKLAVKKQQFTNTLDADYYFTMSEQPNGVVVQIAGFSDSQHLTKFLALYPQQEFYIYQKTLSDDVFTVITSKVYPDRLTALAAMRNFPETITERQLWLKPISTVIAEINTFKE